jgi:hypothetical protein
MLHLLQYWSEQIINNKKSKKEGNEKKHKILNWKQTRKLICRILLTTLLCPSGIRNLWTKPSCIISPWTCTSYEICKPAKFGFRNISQPYLNLVQSLNLLHMSFEIQILNDTKSLHLDKANIYLGTLSNAWSKPTKDFPNFRIFVLADISSNTLWAKSCQIWNYKWATCPAVPGLLGSQLVFESLPCALQLALLLLTLLPLAPDLARNREKGSPLPLGLPIESLRLTLSWRASKPYGLPATRDHRPGPLSPLLFTKTSSNYKPEVTLGAHCCGL